MFLSMWFFCVRSCLWEHNEDRQSKEDEPVWWKCWHLHRVLQTLWAHILWWHFLHCDDQLCKVHEYKHQNTEDFGGEINCAILSLLICCRNCKWTDLKFLMNLLPVYYRDRKGCWVTIFSYLFIQGIYAKIRGSGSKSIHSPQARGNWKISAGVNPSLTMSVLAHWGWCYCFVFLYGESYVTMPLHTHARKHTHCFINHHVLRLPENTVCPFPCFCWADTLMSSVCECMHFWYQKLKQTNITKKKNNAYCFYGHLRISSVQHYRKYIYRIWAVKCSVLSHNLTSKQNIMKWLR